VPVEPRSDRISGVTDFFPGGAVIRRINAEPAILFGAGRALLLQVAHPVVAQGVADHSDFRDNPFRRLQGTLEALNAVVYGSEELALAIGMRVAQLHDHVVGPTYRANDVENLVWVHSTLCDSALEAYRRFVGPLGASDASTYYDEMKRVAEVFGIPAVALPDTLADFRTYFAGMVETMSVTDVGRHLAADIVRPPLPLLVGATLAPLVGVHRLVAVGTTPEPIRERLDLRWKAYEQYALTFLETVSRTASIAIPRPLRALSTSITGSWMLAHANPAAP
jgi:uncharacterized protein (DUF2236 family)